MLFVLPMDAVQGETKLYSDLDYYLQDIYLRKLDTLGAGDQKRDVYV